MRWKLLLSLLTIAAFNRALQAELPDGLLQTFVKPPPTNFARFGDSVVGVGNDVLVSGEDCHAAYLFSGLSGQLLKTYPSPTPAADDAFGFSSAAADGLIYVGAPFDSVGGYHSGAVHVFDAATGSLLRTIREPVPTEYNTIGHSVAARGNKLLIGNFTFGAAVYLYDSNGNRLLTIRNPVPNVDTNFGRRVAFVGNNLLVGAPGNGNSPIVGSVYLFDGSTGQLLRTFRDPVPAQKDQFGFSIVGIENNVLIGAPQDSRRALRAGAAYLYNATTGALVRSFFNPAGDQISNRFGSLVGTVAGDLLVAAPNYQVFDDGGAILGFDGTTYDLLFARGNPHPGNNGFGFSQTPIAAVGNNFATGAWGDETYGFTAGIAYLFRGRVVPEPASVTLAAAAFVGLIAIRRQLARRSGK